MPKGLKEFSGPRIDLRVSIFALIILILLGALVAKLWWLQVARGQYYASRIANSSEVTVRIPAVRGEIKDSHGITLVTNRASYDVDFYLPDVVRGYEQRVGHVPLVSYNSTYRHGNYKKAEEANIVQIVNKSIIPRLDKLGLAQDYNAKTLQTKYRTNREVPFTYLEDINFRQIAEFSEHNIGLAGVNISIQPVREYLFGAFAAHILGYVGAVHDISQEPDVKDYNFYQPDVEGKSNIEKAMDKYLRGKPGVRVMRRNIHGVIDGVERTVPATPGDNVYLTIDARIQMIVEEALRNPAIGRAAAVVVDPNNGKILAMASVPSFDPNTFIPSISTKNWDVLNKAPAGPLNDLAVSGFPPGSTFKVVTALAGLLSGEGNARFDCPGHITYGDRVFHCWKLSGHGVLNLTDAIQRSCDVFFYQYGNAAGIQAMTRAGNMLGIGEPTGLPLTGSQDGIMPGSTWFKAHYPKERFTKAFIANISIGQGFDLASPLQMAMVFATFANGGVCYYPRLIDKVLTPDGKPALNANGTPVVSPTLKVRTDLRTLVTKSQIDQIRKGLYKVVNVDGGTARAARLKDVVVAGKTGTADASDGHGHHEIIAWFCCFAPYDNPKYVVAVMVRAGPGGGEGGAVSAPIAAHILKQLFAMDKGDYKPKLAKLAPARNPDPFRGIVKISYKDNENVFAKNDKETPSTAHSGSASGNVQMEKNHTHPDIRPSTDHRGRVRRAKPVRPAPTPPPEKRRSIFQRFFHPHR